MPQKTVIWIGVRSAVIVVYEDGGRRYAALAQFLGPPPPSLAHAENGSRSPPPEAQFPNTKCTRHFQ
jgi:hypothetical protein